MESTVVIKVKHEEILRRFNARIVNGELDLNLDGLREKIRGLFKFTPDTELVLTYIDEDSDIVTLGDDDDVRDVVRQGLNPVRITVRLSTEKSGRSSARTSGSSTPLRSPRVQQPSQYLNSDVSEILKAVPEPVRQVITKIFTDLAPTPATSAQPLAHLVQRLSDKLLHLNPVPPPVFQTGANISGQGGAPSCTSNVTASHDEGSKVDETASDVLSHGGLGNSTSKSKEVGLNSESKSSDPEKGKENYGNVKGGVKTPTRQVPGLEVVKAALDSVNPESDCTMSIDVRKKKEVVKSGENRSSTKFVNVLNTVTVDNKEASDKPNESSGTKSMDAYAFPSYPANATWSNLDSQTTVATSGARNAFQTDSGNYSGSIFFPSPMDECPFTGLRDSPAVPPQLPSRVVQPRRNHGQSDCSGMIFHRGVCCDGCGVHPITGPRFKSKVKDDYDLCNICFTQMGNENDYIRMDRPMTYRHPYSFKGLYDVHSRVHPPVQPPVFRCGGVKSGRPKLDSRFIQDVNILDGTFMAPSTPFTKIWRMRNNGSLVWPQGTQLVWIGGDKLSDIFSVEIEIASVGLPVDQELDVAVDFVAPDRPGRYISYWRMASPSGQKFGQRVWVLIQVDASSKELPNEGFRGFNLNLPPVSNGISGPEIINVNPESVVEDSLPELDSSNGIAVQLVEPVVDASPEKEQDVNFPINDTLLVGGGAPSSHVPDAPSSSVSYPIIDMSEEVAPALPSPLPSPVTVVQISAQDVKENTNVEETLLKDLEEMGFKQIDLNKEILRLNEYDLEKSVDDLCDVSDWDPILEELKVMGFRDKATNKKLLLKNNGSMTRVVMDLIAEEE